MGFLQDRLARAKGEQPQPEAKATRPEPIVQSPFVKRAINSQLPVKELGR